MAHCPPRRPEPHPQSAGQSRLQGTRRGSTQGRRANAVYWVQKTYTHPNGDVVVQNITEGAKIEVEQVSMRVEPDLLYPLLRGRDVQRWHAQPSAWIIVPRLEPEQVIPSLRYAS
jgi:hypothetical protein